MSPKGEFEKPQKKYFKYKPRTLLVRKFNDNEYSKKNIKSKLSEFFYSPDKFFDIKANIFLNKKINLRKIIPIEKDSIQNDKISTFKESNNTRNNSRLTMSLRIKNKSTNNINIKDNLSLKKNFEIIDNEKLKNIFKSYKDKSQIKNEKKENNNSMFYDKRSNDYNKLTIPRQLSMNLNIQNRRLRTKNHLDRQSINISKYLSKKLHKNESDLLFNGVHLYRFKKEIMDNDDDNNLRGEPKKITEQSCLFRWVSSLRRPDIFYGKRESYINVSSENNPLWSIVVERNPRLKEMSVKSGYNLNNRNYKDFIRKRNLSLVNSTKLRSVENLDEINIKGEKLYDVEYNREMSNNSSKILHKVFVDNGKVISYQDVNDIFGNETIYKNYQVRNNESSFGNRSLDNMNIRYSTGNIFV